MPETNKTKQSKAKKKKKKKKKKNEQKQETKQGSERIWVIRVVFVLQVICIVRDSTPAVCLKAHGLQPLNPLAVRKLLAQSADAFLEQCQPHSTTFVM